MSRTIKSIESSGAALAALCLAGVASQANAATVTVPFPIAHDSNTATNIAIDSSTPQFVYDSYVDTTYITGAQKANFNTQNSGLIAASLNNGSPTVDPSLVYSSGSTQVSYKNGLEGSGYVQLAFLNGSGIEEFGFASFNEFGDLVSITYEPAAATPLPASWALFVGGTGMLGLLARRRRKAAA
jgi:hypothetical protein